MDRREFFRRGLGRVAEEAVQHVDKKVVERASRWIRPPFAIPELEFLLACTRCDACIKACPHDIVFPLAASNGADVMNTPALDLLNKGCRLCEDWPCVTACETQALKLPAAEDETDSDTDPADKLDLTHQPRLAKLTIDTENCLPYKGPECGACASACIIEGALEWKMERPSINQQKCTGCAMCREVCITEPKSVLIMKSAQV
ncbi:Ferredoxin-type protein NapF (periplasmic nitrate reductase) [hydrothermal vent metagenome]|uniref:Ferredoxin-type protein NapF (Periplasmic nitrate reductase) n=1 Tax=hydrothermal vent metagenome TaxID=652676 RepID=A0A3B1A966_9ZZZZ